MENKDKDPTRRRSKAVNSAALRAVVAGYLLYLGISMIADQVRGRSALSPVLSWLLGLLFAASGIVFGLYTWRRWKAEEKAAAETDEDEDVQT